MDLDSIRFGRVPKPGEWDLPFTLMKSNDFSKFLSPIFWALPFLFQRGLARLWQELTLARRKILRPPFHSNETQWFSKFLSPISWALPSLFQLVLWALPSLFQRGLARLWQELMRARRKILTPPFHFNETHNFSKVLSTELFLLYLSLSCELFLLYFSTDWR